MPNERLDGVALTAATPVPLSATVCGLLLPVSAIVSVPVRKPRAVGVKVTEIVHLLPAARVVEQLVVRIKSARLELMLLMLIVVVWLFFKVTFCAELEVPST